MLFQSLSSQTITFRLNEIPTKGKDSKKELEIVISKYFQDSFQVFQSKLIPKDSIAVFEFKMNTEDTVGLYSIYINDKAEKEINKAEFIWSNSEKLNIESNFYELKNGSISIEKSNENDAYNRLNAIRKEYEMVFIELLKKRQNLSPLEKEFKKKSALIEIETEKFQLVYNNTLAKLSEIFPNTYTAKILIPLNLIPVRSVKESWINEFDSYLSFLNSYYFYHQNTKSDEILHHYSFTEKLFFYLNNFCIKGEMGQKNGIDTIMTAIKDNQKVSNYVYNLLLKTYIKLENEELTNYITHKYSNGCSLNLPFEELKKLNAIQTLSVGNITPEISLPNIDNKYFSLKEFCSKNKVTIVFVWMSWCGRCNKELPLLNELYAKFKSKKIGVYCVSLDEKKENWLNGNHLIHKDWVNVAELVTIKNSSIVSNFNIHTTPFLFLLDKQGKIIAKNNFGDELQNFIKNYTDKN